MPTTVNTTNNTVTITDEKSSVLVTNNNTGNSVGVTGVDTSTITISDVGPKGDKGDAGSVEDYSGTLSGDHITLTGNISASGDLTVKDILTSGKITSAGNVSSSAYVIAQQLYTDEFITHNGDINTYIQFTDDRIRFRAGGVQYLDLNDASAAPHEIVFNKGSNNIDVSIEGSSDDKLFFTDASTNKVGIGTKTPSYKLDVDGDIRVTGGLIVDGNYNNSSIHSTNILLQNAVKYTDTGGDARYALHFDSDVVVLTNRTSNGIVQIKANTSTAGSGGETTVAQFEDDRMLVSAANIDFTNLPTSDPGVAGRLWRNGNDVKISTG